MTSVESERGGPPHGGRHDSRDSGVSSGSSQDYGECTPTAEKNLNFPRFPASSDRPSLPMSQLVRKLSEVEGISPSSHVVNAVLKTTTSIDEGVTVDMDEPAEMPPLQQQQQHMQKSQKSSSFDSANLTVSGSGGTLIGDAGLDRALR